jgi:hypothetical protein
MKIRQPFCIAVLIGGFAADIVAQTYTAFDVPGATATYPVAINSGGDVAGWFCPNSCFYAQMRGFIRERDGSITVFDGIPTGMNNAGTVVGNFLNNAQCFLRDKNGNVTVFDVPQINTFRSPFVDAINDSGKVAGYKPICNLCDGTEGFVRDRQGNITLFQGGPAVPTSINASGDVAGHTVSEAFPWHGVVRDRDGDITVFDVPEAGNGAGIRAFPTGINNNGGVAGYYEDSEFFRQRGFIRERDGTITVFDGLPLTINERGDVAGSLSDTTGLHNFLRDQKGNVTVFDVPSAFSPQISSMNDGDDITGYFYEVLQDGSLAVHGFVRSAH